MTQQPRLLGFRDRVAQVRACLTERLRAFRPGPRTYATAFCVGATIGEYAALANSTDPAAILAAITALGAQLGVNLLADIIGDREPPPDLTEEEIAQAVQRGLERGDDLPAVRALLQEFGTLQLALETWRQVEDERWQQLVGELSAHPQLIIAQVTAALGPRLATIEERTQLILELLEMQARVSPPIFWSRPGSAPPLPTLIIGREDTMRDLKERLGITISGQTPAPVQVLTAVRGWPGVGKTTLAAALAHDPEISNAFPDGVLWVSLGQNPNLLSELATWGRALGTEDLLRARTLEEATARLTALLRNKRMFLIVDDVWESEHAIPFRVGGRGCAMLITTRLNSVAQALAPTPNDIYRLDVLTDEKALELLQALAPTVVAQYPEQSLELIRELEGLPLALQVAGHLLHAEASCGFGVTDLLTELRQGTKLLEAKAPADRADLAKETTPTVAVLLQKSTNRLDPLVRDCFAYLGVFAPRPATFDLAAMKAVWQVEDPKPIAYTLVDRGLLEFVPEMRRYQMHALLVMHAKSLLTEE